MDLMVKKTQEWLNATYAGNKDYVKVDEDGITGSNTVKALIRALQIELGVTVDGSLGKNTLAKFGRLTRGCNTVSASKKRQVFILQGGLYCKGYDPNGLDGGYGNGVEKAVKKLKTDAGLNKPDGVADATFMKALLTTDGYVLAKTGDANIRQIQQSLNRNYVSEIGLIPCDGIFVKQTQKALIKGLQYEQRKKVSSIVVDGIWGKNTMNNCPILERGKAVDNTNFVYLLQYALYVNGFGTNGFTGELGADTQNAIMDFQNFVALPPTGIANKQTWASLMVSYGDKNRKGIACDCMKPLTKETAETLVNDGRKIVGRYIVGGSNKKLTLAEEKIIYNAGLKIMPIYQRTNNSAAYFTSDHAEYDAVTAYRNLCNLKFPDETTFYVAVDFDASENDIKNNIIPYFKVFKDIFDDINDREYKIGAYGPRQVCTLLAPYISSSFVCDMSSGFAGNIGHKLPKNWAYDQISTIKVGTGNGEIEIDNNITSGKDSGVLVDPDRTLEPTLKEKNNYRRTKTNDVLKNLKIGKSFLKSEFDFEEEIQIISGPPVDVYVKASANVAVNNNANYAVTVTNGEIMDAEFSSTIANITAKLGSIEPVNVTPDFVALAETIGNGRFEIEEGFQGEKFYVSIKSIIYKDENDLLSEDMSVTLKFVTSFDTRGMAEANVKVWEEFKECVENIDWSTAGLMVLAIVFIFILYASGAGILEFIVELLEFLLSLLECLFA